MRKSLSRWLQSRSDRFQRYAKLGKTFILPTKLGIYISLFCFVFLGLAYAYQNNLVYLYVFSTFSIFVVAMAICNRNLQKLSLEHIAINPYFADLEGQVSVSLKPLIAEPIRQVRVSFNDGLETSNEYFAPGTSTRVQLSLPKYRRGIHSIPRVTLSSSFPFGFFRSWKYVSGEGNFIVYPAREGLRQFPEGSSESEASGAGKLRGSNEDFAGHKAWNTSMPVRRIDWKVKARTGQWMVQSFEGGDQGGITLDWYRTAHIGDFEKRLSQMSLWIDMANLSLREFEIILPGWRSGKGRGADHAHICWQRLAVMNTEASQ